ncbi:MAG: ATP-binding cassette domain-containing protein, partial [Bacillati bacterium ANGP1]
MSRQFAIGGGAMYQALDRVSFAVARGEFLAIVGPTGCGKSTILSLAAGLLRPTSGRILSFSAPLERLNRRAAYL